MKLTRIISGLSLSILLSLGLQACSGNSKSISSDSDVADSGEIVNDTVDAEQVAPKLLETPDLTLLEVKGNVKSITTKGMSPSAKFDEKGNLTHYGNSEPLDKISHVKRDENGYLLSFLGSEWMTVKWADGRPSSISDQYNELTQTFTNTYDNDGRVVKMVYRLVDEIENSDETETRQVTYPADGFDEKGNWIKRTVKTAYGPETETREIVYY